MKLFVKGLAVYAVGSLIAAGSAFAGSVSGGPAAVPEVIQSLADKGIDFTYLGDDGGMHGYLGEMPGGEIQSFYVFPTGEFVITGSVYDKGGNNVTGTQIEEMRRRIERAQEKFGGSLLGGTVAVPAPQPTDVSDSGENVADADSDEAPEFITPAIQKPVEAPAASQFDSFVSEASGVAWFSVGSEDLPPVYLVADPGDEDVHTVWKDLIPFIRNGEFQVRVILVSLEEATKDAARAILSREHPGKAWVSGEGSSDKTIADLPKEGSPAYAQGEAYLSANMKLADTFGINTTPLFVYEANDGTVRHSVGKPEDLKAWVADINK